MKIIYFSALDERNFSVLRKLGEKIDFLQSYFELQATDKLSLDRSVVNKFFLDSGAYSAYSRGKTININKYVEFIHNNLDDITAYANLDVKDDLDKTLKNQEFIESQGLMPLPVYHYGEPIDVLKHYHQKYAYIALGGSAGMNLSFKQIDSWINKIYIQFPGIQLHGFGITNIDLVKYYPWKSCDSTTALNGQRFGNITCQGKQIHHKKLHGLKLWDELNEFLDKCEITLDEFLTAPAYHMSVFNVIQIKKLSTMKEHGKINQLSLF